jgi:hypothetical protein
MGSQVASRELAELARAARQWYQCGKGTANDLVTQGKRPLEGQTSWTWQFHTDHLRTGQPRRLRIPPDRGRELAHPKLQCGESVET